MRKQKGFTRFKILNTRCTNLILVSKRVSTIKMIIKTDKAQEVTKGSNRY